MQRRCHGQTRLAFGSEGTVADGTETCDPGCQLGVDGRDTQNRIVVDTLEASGEGELMLATRVNRPGA
jgi:hypothetical protein